MIARLSAYAASIRSPGRTLPPQRNGRPFAAPQPGHGPLTTPPSG
jgi:hypothetical protein